MDEGKILNGRYRLTGRLGSGGMSVVWRAEDEVLGRPVAVKVLAGQFATDPDWRRRIRTEAQAAARLNHPNVTNVYDYGETDEGHPFVVMELLRGTNLAARIKDGPLPPAAAIRICAEVASGLAAAHTERLVHRDVKPGNVMLTPGAAKLVDFGIVGVAGDPDGPDPNGPVLGTPAYLAPERLQGEEVTPASDVYAFGLLLYRCLTGRLPWDNETTTQMVLAHVTVAPDPLPPLDGVPPDIRALCMRCLAKDPGDRPTAAQAAEALSGAAGMLPPLRFDDVPVDPQTGVSTELVSAGVVVDERRDRRRVLIGMAVVVAIAALLVTFVLGRPTMQPQASAESARTTPPATTAAAPSTASSPESGVSAVPTAQSGSAGPQGGGPAGGTVTDGGPAGGPGGGPGGQGGGGTGGPGPTQPGGGGDEDDEDEEEEVRGNAVRLTTLGGVIVAACVGDKVDVTSAQPLLGVKLLKVETGVRDKSRVEFDKLGVKLRFEVRCVGGLPVATPA